MTKSTLNEVVTGLKTPNLEALLDLTPDIASPTEKLAEKMSDKTVIHVNATPTGGGVAELLQSQVPLENSLGIDSHWLTIKTAPEFFVITKKLHNLLQGAEDCLFEEEKRSYLEVNRELADSLSQFIRDNSIDQGILLVHDPQPLAMLSYLPDDLPLDGALRLHIDLSSPDPKTLDLLRPYIDQYARVILSSENYLHSMPWLDREKVNIIQPAINPFSPKNAPMALPEARKILNKFGLDTTKPIMTQVSRFDPWKGPLGVVEAFRRAKEQVPELQLIMVGFMTAKDDPEAETVLKQIRKAVLEDEDVFLFHDPKQLLCTTNDEFVNAAYTASDIIVQNSLREGFGLTMTEAMWHEKPLIAGITTGSKLQITNKETGLLVSSSSQIAEHIVNLLAHPEEAKRLGKAAKKSVEKRYLLSHYLLANLNAYKQCL